MRGEVLRGFNVVDGLTRERPGEATFIPLHLVGADAHARNACEMQVANAHVRRGRRRATPRKSPPVSRESSPWFLRTLASGFTGR